MAKRVVGYFENWAQYRQSGGKFLPAQINPGFFTHINFAFGLIGFVTWSVDPSPARTGSQRYTGDYTVQPVEWNDQTVLYPAIQALKQQNGSLKTLLSIGGWSMNSCDDTPNPGNPHPYGPFTCQLFSKMAADLQGRSQFINSAISYARKYGFDGIDIDWEYPGYVGRGGGPNDLANFLAFAQEFRAAAGPGFLLTMASPAIVPTGLPQNYHDDPASYFQWLQQCSQSFDWLNVMSYDYHGAFDDPVKIGTGVNSPLVQDSTPTGPFSIKKTVEIYLAAGIPADKMVLGMPTYGRGYTVANPGALAVNSSYGQPFSGPAPAGPATQVPGVLAYYEIAPRIAGGSLTQKWDAATLTPYAYNSTTGEWVSYDNPDSVAYKTAYVNAMNLGGAMIWSIDDDDFANGYPLVTQIKDILDHPEHGPQLPGTSTSQVNFPLDLLGIFTSDLSPASLTRLEPRADTSSDVSRGAATASRALLTLSGAPAVANYNGVLWFFYEGPFENGVLNCTTLDESSAAVTTTNVKIANNNNGTTGRPAVAIYDDKIYCVHEGAGQSGILYYFTYDDATGTWTDDQLVPLGCPKAGSQRHNYPSVALATLGDRLFCVYEGGETRGGGQLWFNIMAYNDATPENGPQWGSGGRVQDFRLNGFGTSNGPGLAVIGDNLFCFHEGAFQDGQMWCTIYNQAVFGWTPDSKLNVTTSGPPALVAVLDGVQDSVPLVETGKIYAVHEQPRQDGVENSFNNTDYTDRPLAGGKPLYFGAVSAQYIREQTIQVFGEGRIGNSGSGQSVVTAITIPKKPKFGWKLYLKGARATQPYPTLPYYNTALTQSNSNTAQGQYPVSMARHHIIPYNVLVTLWDTMLDRGDMAAAGRGGGYASGFLGTLAHFLLSYDMTMNYLDRVSVWLTLMAIQSGFVFHNKDADALPTIDNLATVYEWLPGDLFVGPDSTWRSDDPGEDFETKAGIIVGSAFRTWKNANTKIDDYVNGSKSTASLKSALTGLQTIARRTELFPLNANDWNFNTRTQKYGLIIPPQLELQSRLEETVAAE